MIDASDPAWSAASPALQRHYLCTGTPLALRGYRRPVEAHETLWLHAALTGALGRPHGAQSRGGIGVPDWALVPWETPSGWAVVWTSVRDGELMTGRRVSARIGRVPCEMAFGPLVRLRTPPTYAAGAHALTLTARTPVVIRSTTGRSRGAVSRDEPQRKVYRTEATSSSLEHALCGIARRLGVRTEGVRVVVVDQRTVAQRVRLRERDARVEGWVGHVDLVASAPARWLLECAARGLGLGGRTAYGCGRVEVTPAMHEAVRGASAHG